MLSAMVWRIPAGPVSYTHLDVYKRQLLAAPEFTNQTTGIIRSQKVNFEYAVKQVEENYRQILASDNAAYASSSMADFSVVVNAVIEALQSGVQRDTLTGPCILASHDLTPEQTIRFDKSKLLGFVTVDGNSLSHTAILALSLIHILTDAIPEKIREGMLETIPLRRGGKAEDVANAVAFLASDDAGYITGQVLKVDGGMVM